MRRHIRDWTRQIAWWNMPDYHELNGGIIVVLRITWGPWSPRFRPPGSRAPSAGATPFPFWFGRSAQSHIRIHFRGIPLLFCFCLLWIRESDGRGKASQLEYNGICRLGPTIVMSVKARRTDCNRNWQWRNNTVGSKTWDSSRELCWHLCFLKNILCCSRLCSVVARGCSACWLRSSRSAMTRGARGHYILYHGVSTRSIREWLHTSQSTEQNIDVIVCTYFIRNSSPIFPSPVWWVPNDKKRFLCVSSLVAYRICDTL